MLELSIERVTTSVLQSKNSRQRTLPDNLPKESRESLNDMKSWKEVIIQPADKGSKIFLLDRADYITKVEEHLNDKETFEKVKNNDQAIQRVIDSIKQWILMYVGEPGMTLKMITFLEPNEDCKAGNNFVNPKAHKPQSNYPGRCISTGCASYTKNLSALTAFELSKVELPYCIKDTNRFLRLAENMNNTSSLQNIRIYHVSFDVVCMFPSISQSFDLNECKKHQMYSRC